jgi:hypothetical protein
MKIISCVILMSFCVGLSAEEKTFTVEGLAKGVRNAHASDFGFHGAIVTLTEARGLPTEASKRLLKVLNKSGYKDSHSLKDHDAIILIPETELLTIRLGWCVRVSGYTEPTIEEGKIKRAGTFQLIQHATRPRPLYSRRGLSILEHDQRIKQDIDLKHPNEDQLLSVPRLIELSDKFLQEGFGDDFKLTFKGFIIRPDRDLMGDTFWCAYVMYFIPENLRDSIGSEVLTVRLLPNGEILMRMVKNEIATIPKFEDVEQAVHGKPPEAPQPPR